MIIDDEIRFNDNVQRSYIHDHNLILNIALSKHVAILSNCHTICYLIINDYLLLVSPNHNAIGLSDFNLFISCQQRIIETSVNCAIIADYLLLDCHLQPTVY